MKKLYVIGLGPGNIEKMTIEAHSALEEAHIIIGYSVYIELIKKYFENKEFISGAMKKEVQRCELAINMANEGNIVAMVCSGDSGVYGMAGLILELAKDYDDLEIKIIPGISSALAGAALIGAPLMHDFAIISLSDLLTPWEKISLRLELASKGDFVISIYNPSSKNRSDYLQKACDIMLKYKSKDTPCAIVNKIAREGENYQIMDLEALRNAKADMFSTIFIGNSQTKIINNKIVTPRGYKINE